jgi:uncharacterized membrane protein
MDSEEPPQEPRRRGFRTGRLEAFSDGVFAIAVTLLVLDITVPGDAGQHLLRSVADLWPSYLAYVVSFATIGAAWLGHNAITRVPRAHRRRIRAPEPAAAPRRLVSAVPHQAARGQHQL